ncbi:MAG TPA: 2-oxoglutarate ferredoxin oxidoreductase subunit alpha, partial [Candidatus Nitrosotenuis sp.]|nr:2-oxoglutarate ferredoxin oxidoreductase subunit alpha [Candidatus Nitrosotenuis sp.]
ATPEECFYLAIEAFRLAVRIMSPVLYLSDGYLANTSEPWSIPDPDKLPRIEVRHRTNPEGFYPYQRDPVTLGRPWALPGTPGLEHRIGGLGKAPVTGNVSYRPQDHEKMVLDRAEKVARLAEVLPEQEVIGPASGDVLVVSWGGTYGAVRQAVLTCIERGKRVACAHLRYLNPFPRNLAQILTRYKKILVPELNLGQLALLLRGRLGVDVISYPKVQGRPFKVAELVRKIEELI